ncbi:MAG: ABC transporter permease, partial [Candidatus Krumholzibacteriota bacterium]|nr:ABC transporter permease [Candidatus Krumholzibacteriota bacterium]
MRRMADIGESFQIAFGAIRANKGRGALTTLGIIIGIVAVVVTMTAANGLKNTARQSFSAVGTDVIHVSRMPWVIMNDFFLFRNRPRIELRQARALERKLQGKGIVNPSMDTRRDVQYRSERMDGVRIVGTTDKQTLVFNAQPEIGRFMTSFDVTYKKKVCIIGTDVRDGVFGSVNPINQSMKIGRTSFRVIGVMEEQGGGFLGGPNFDRQIFIPITSYVRAFGGRRGRQNVDLAIKAPTHESMEELEFEVIGEMRKIRQLRPSEP